MLEYGTIPESYITEYTLVYEDKRCTVFPLRSVAGCRSHTHISQKLFIDYFRKVYAPTKSSSYCLLLLIKVLS